MPRDLPPKRVPTFWLRWYVGTCSHPKLHAMAKALKVPPVFVLGVWARFLEQARRNEYLPGRERGDISDLRDSTIAGDLGIDVEIVSSIRRSMETRGMIKADVIRDWEERNPRRDDQTASERQRQYRERKRQRKAQSVLPLIEHAEERAVGPEEASLPTRNDRVTRVTGVTSRRDDTSANVSQRSRKLPALPTQTESPNINHLGDGHAGNADNASRRKRDSNTTLVQSTDSDSRVTATPSTTLTPKIVIEPGVVGEIGNRIVALAGMNPAFPWDFSIVRTWLLQGLTGDDIVGAIGERIARKRQREPGWTPTNFGYFNFAMTDVLRNRTADSRVVNDQGATPGNGSGHRTPPSIDTASELTLAWRAHVAEFLNSGQSGTPDYGAWKRKWLAERAKGLPRSETGHKAGPDPTDRRIAAAPT